MTICKIASIDRFQKVETDEELIFNNSNSLHINYMNSA